MGNVLKSLITFDTSKVDPMKGVRQGLLLIFPALLGYFLGNFALGLFVSPDKPLIKDESRELK